MLFRSELSPADVELPAIEACGDRRRALSPAPLQCRLVAAAGAPAVPVVGAGGECGGLGVCAYALSLPFLVAGFLGSPDGTGVAGRVT